ncbi:type I restriction-modification enzyme R subunit C-terminal domain-containing protein [Crocosphaera sp. XPORK-15E]|uniref:type I restriction-modification enzyme R subunit C-terminal domain-containing protein n=1 Tax=Crocosphaera sp. XPORK-15E TaxID=3110247 RepID=UPI002B20DACE|nr:type I restriction-modification enzyme R subunit C-terminal domain-containing protein [Crocosphaera sp. XPORK-15E]MEA5535262.1 type I restriction-modification enzyme R subunit C-terminal domain-containing protein [Crocosphaera sp. XPORK-15E]
MNEADTRAELIDPALRAAGWGIIEESRIRREVIAPGRLIGGGRRAKSKFADYVLIYRNQKLGIIEAKADTEPYTEGVQQAKDYGDRLQVRYTYATNGRKIYQIDMLTGKEQNIEQYPTPEELWNMTYPSTSSLRLGSLRLGSGQAGQAGNTNEWRDRFSSIPFEDKSGTWEARYYQHNAITKVLEAIANNQDRMLLTLATGTGKTCIAFQGRGTRIFEGKDYFTIYDFVRAHEKFNDPEWDGPPQEPPTGITPRSGGLSEVEVLQLQSEVEGPQRREKIVIELADGKKRTLQHSVQTTYWSPDGKPLSATAFVKRLYGELPALFQDEIELRRLWSRPDTRHTLLEGLAEKGYGEEQMTAIQKLADAENSDVFDVLTFIAYAKPPLSRRERVIAHKSLIFSRYTGKQQEFLDFVLDQYIREGVRELAQDKLPQLLELKYHSINDAISELGDVGQIREVFVNFQAWLYLDEKQAS